MCFFKTTKKITKTPKKVNRNSKWGHMTRIAMWEQYQDYVTSF